MLKYPNINLRLPRTCVTRIAYAFTTDPEKVYTIDSWPGAEDRIVPKTPTVIKYEQDSSLGFKWGYELEQTLDEKITNLKLLFDLEQQWPYSLSVDVEAEVAKLPKPVAEIATDYIKAIFEHAVREIESGFLDQDFIKSYSKQYILTVPAVWSEKAKYLTLKVTMVVDFGLLSLMTRRLLDRRVLVQWI